MRKKGVCITGFGPFGQNEENPSGAMADLTLEVSYAAVVDWLDSFDASSVDSLLLLGLSHASRELRIERLAHNRIGRHPDVRGVVPELVEIEAGGPQARRGTLWQGPLTPTALVRTNPLFRISDDAGDYLCNFVYYEALRRFSELRVGFLHVPPFTVVPREGQEAAIDGLLVRV